MKIWTFFDFLVEGRTNDMRGWMRDLPAQARARFDTLIGFLEVTQEWRRPAFDVLHGKQYQRVAELRFAANKVEYWPLGSYGPNRHEFTLLIGCEKKSSIYRPPRARETAVNRRKDLDVNPTWVEVHRGSRDLNS
jgi:hypothetical protein